MTRRVWQVFFDESYWDVTQSVLEPECGGSIDTLNFTFSGWGYWENRFPEPCVCRWHWLENKRMTHVCDRLLRLPSAAQPAAAPMIFCHAPLQVVTRQDRGLAERYFQRSRPCSDVRHHGFMVSIWQLIHR